MEAMADIIPLLPRNFLTQKAVKIPPLPKAARQRLRQVGVDPDLGDILAEYSAMRRLQMKDIMEEALEAYGLREKYARLLEERAARARATRKGK